MNNFALFIAKRIYSDVRIATAGVAIGVAVMIVSVCVVLGFKHTIRDKVIGFGCHATVSNFRTAHNISHEPMALNDSLTDVLRGVRGVKHVQRYAYKQGILKTDSDFLGVMLKGVGEEYDTLFLHACLTEGSLPAFDDESATREIVISQKMADQLLLKAGDRVFAYFIDGDNLRTRRFTVKGVYRSNMSQFDNNIVFTDLYTAQKLNGWDSRQVSGVEISVHDFDRLEDTENALIYDIAPRYDADGQAYTPATVQETYPQIFSWLGLLDINVWIILALMTCVAAVTMISGLLIIILERTNMIGVLKALGARDGTVRRTFLWFGAFIIGKGLLIGDIIGVGLVALQHFTGMVKLDASTYYVDMVPVEIDVPVIVLINIATLIINVFVLVAPSYLISKIHPARSIRFE